MIQRIQTVWLLLAAIASFLLTRIPLFVGKATGMPDRYYLATESLPLFILAVVPGIIAVVSIFLFKNRKRQLRLSIMGIFTSLPFLFWEMQKISDFVKVNPARNAQNHGKVAVYQLSTFNSQLSDPSRKHRPHRFHGQRQIRCRAARGGTAAVSVR